jgi:hypothetical protein
MLSPKYSDPKQATLDYSAYFQALSNAAAKSKSASGKQRIAKLDKDNFIYSAVVGLEGNCFNANWDYIPHGELLAEIKDRTYAAADDGQAIPVKHAWQTWIGRPNPRNHKLEDIARDSYGFVADAHYDPDKKFLYMLLATDRQKDPALARAIELQLQRDVSAGWKVAYSKCSYCGHPAYKEGDYCDHIRRQKGHELSMKASPNQEWVKYCQANFPNVVSPTGMVRIGEICFGIEGIEESWVTNGAFANAKLVEILKGASAQDAQLVGGFLKSAGVQDADALIAQYVQPDYKSVLGDSLFKTSPEAQKHASDKRGVYGRPTRNATWSK